MAVYHVSLTGNDTTGSGSASLPWRTIAKGMSVLVPGDTLYLMGGIWNESINNLNTIKGLPGSFITIETYPPHFASGNPAILQNIGQSYAIVPWHLDYMVFRNLVFDGQFMDHTSVINGIPYGGHGVYGCRIINTTTVVFEGCEWKSLWGLIYTEGCNGVTIRNCKIHDFQTVDGSVGTRYMGIYARFGSNLTIEGNDIYGNPGGGMQIQPGPWSGVIVRNNKIHDNVFLANQPGVGGIIVYRDGAGGPITGTEIYNNVIYRQGVGVTPATLPQTNYAPGINVASLGPSTPGPDGTKIWNNTCYENWGYGISVINSAITNTVIQNNICYKNHGGAWPTGTGNILNSGAGTILSNNLTTDPLFVSEPSNNFRIQPGSAALDTGLTLTAFSTDHVGITRPKGLAWDIGAYEFTPTGVTYYITTLGNDTTGDGSIDFPWRTIQKGISVVVQGDTILVDDGIYTAAAGQLGVGLITGTTQSGQIGLPITLKSINKYGAKLTVTSINGSQNTGLLIGKSYWVIDGFEISGGTASATGTSMQGILVSGFATTGTVVRNCKIHDIGRTVCSSSSFGFNGVYLFNATNTLFEDCIIHTIGRLQGDLNEGGCTLTPNGNSDHDHGFYLETPNGITIQRCLIYDCFRGYAIHVFKSGGGTHRDLKFYNLTFADKNSVGFPKSHIILCNSIVNCEVKNCISYDPNTAMFDYFGVTGFTNVQVDYNLCSKVMHATTAPAGVTTGPNNLVNTNPLFVNPTIRDYQLQASSPAINSGVNVGLPYSGSAPDRGYIEFASVLPDTTPPAIPTGVMVI